MFHLSTLPLIWGRRKGRVGTRPYMGGGRYGGWLWGGGGNEVWIPAFAGMTDGGGNDGGGE